MADEPTATAEGIPTPDGGTLPMAATTVVDKVDVKNDVQLEIEGVGDGQSMTVYIRAPELAKIIRKMAMSNYPGDKYAEVYKPILMPHPDAGKDPKYKGSVVTRAAIAKTTKNFRGATDFSFEEAPTAILLANPDALEAGYKLTLKLDKPAPPEVLKKWGKQFIDGCGDIMTNARPFKFTWTMQQTPTYK